MHKGKHPYSWGSQMVMQWSLRNSRCGTVLSAFLHKAQTCFRFASKYFLVCLNCCMSLCCTKCKTEQYLIVHLWCALLCALFHHLHNIFSLRQFSVQIHTHCKQAREILSSFQPCNETNDFLPARQCRGRFWTRQVQLRLKLLCLNLAGQNGDFRKVASWGKCK